MVGSVITLQPCRLNWDGLQSAAFLFILFYFIWERYFYEYNFIYFIRCIVDLN